MQILIRSNNRKFNDALIKFLVEHKNGKGVCLQFVTNNQAQALATKKSRAITKLEAEDANRA